MIWKNKNSLLIALVISTILLTLTFFFFSIIKVLLFCAVALSVFSPLYTILKRIRLELVFPVIIVSSIIGLVLFVDPSFSLKSLLRDATPDATFIDGNSNILILYGYNIQNAFLNFWKIAAIKLMPDYIDVLLVSIVLLLLVVKRGIKKLVLIYLPNKWFECCAHLLYKLGYQVGFLIRFQLLKSVIITGCLAIALYLLHINHPVVVLCLIFLAALSPVWGLWLAFIVPLFFILPSDNYYFQIVGLIISYASIWLVQHVLFYMVLEEKIPGVCPVYLLLLIPVFVLLFGASGYFIALPLLVFFLLTLKTLAESFPLIHKTSIDS